jgi:hypothetical protein
VIPARMLRLPSRFCVSTHMESQAMNTNGAHARRKAPLDTPIDLTFDATRILLAHSTPCSPIIFALYLKTKNFR